MARLLRSALALGMATAVIASLSACVPGEAPSDEQPQSATILIQTGFTSLDPALVSDGYSRVVHSFLYDKLIGKDPQTGKTVSNLASSWEITSTHAHFKIKDGITCSDGKPFTASTVVRNLERFKDPATKSPLTAGFLGSYSYTAALGTDQSSVEITFDKPFAFAEAKLAEGPGFVCDSGLDDPSVLEKTSAGTGPYVLTSAKTGDTYEMKLRDDYAWGINGAKASHSMPKTVTFRFLADQDAMANLITSRGADVAILRGSANERVKGTGNVSVIRFTTATTSAFFNHREGMATADPAVRKALSQAVSREDFNSVAGDATSSAATSLTDSSATCSAAGKLDSFLPSGGSKAAESTLIQAGWAKSNSGIWAKNGVPLTVRILNLDVPAAGIEYLRSAWSALGVDTKVDSRSGSEAITTAFAGTEWDVTVTGYGAAYLPINLLSGPLPPNGSNFSAIQNPAFDSALHTAIAGGTDCDKWHGTEEALMQQTDILPLMVDRYDYLSPDFDLGPGPSTFYLVPTNLKKRA